MIEDKRFFGVAMVLRWGNNSSSSSKQQTDDGHDDGDNYDWFPVGHRRQEIDRKKDQQKGGNGSLDLPTANVMGAVSKKAIKRGSGEKQSVSFGERFFFCFCLSTTQHPIGAGEIEYCLTTRTFALLYN